MPKINRRGFLQILGAAGLTPFLPTMPARAIAAKSGASASKALWASIYANSGSMTEFVGVAKNMGLSNTAIQGVGARSIGVRMALTATSEKLASTGTKTVIQSRSPHSGKLQIRDNLKRAFEFCFSDEEEDTRAAVDEEVRNLGEEIHDEENVTQSSDNNIQS